MPLENAVAIARPTLNGDGICDVPGCTDMEACNYDPLANTDDGGCEYAVLYYDCSGDCINDSDGDGVCDELEVSGCTDSAKPAIIDDEPPARTTAAAPTSRPPVGIDGSAVVDEGATQLYVAMPSEPGNGYTWAVSGGSLLSGQGTSLVTVEWTTSGAHSIQVVETNASCTGGVINLDVDVLEVTSIATHSIQWIGPCGPILPESGFRDRCGQYSAPAV